MNSTAAKVGALLEEARVHHGAGRLAEAEALYRQMLEASPYHPDALHLLGVIKYQVGESAQALELIDGAIRARPEFGEAYFSRGDVLYALGRYQEAVESFDKALQLNPLHAEAHNNRGGALHALKRYEKALEDFERALQLKPEYAEARRNRGIALQDFTQEQAALRAPVKTESSGRDLVFYCGPSDEIWNPETARTKGIGGSEEAIIWLSRLLHKRGWNVTVYANCGAEAQDYDGVSWSPYWLWNHRDRQDATVVWRYPHFTQYDINSGQVIVEMQDTLPEQDFTPDRLQKIYKIFVKSHFHRSLYPSIPDEKFVVVPNGIDANLFAGQALRDPLLLINTSSAGRSLEAFLDCFEEIKKQVPDAKARWAYGWDVWDTDPFMPAQRREWKARMQARMQALGVEELGRIGHGKVAELYYAANVFAYPSEYAEVDCISLSKAMAAGAIPITTDFAAMGEKSGHGGVFLHSNKTKDDWIQPKQFHFEITDPAQKTQFVREAVKLLLNPPTEKEREPMREWARQAFDWNAVADVWNEVLTTAPAALDGLLQKGRAHHVAGRLVEAQAVYREMLEAAPGHPDALHLLGVIAYQVGQAAPALELIDKAIEARLEFAEAYFSRGNVLYALERYGEAVESFDKTLELNPVYAEAHNNRGGALHALKRYEEALKSFEKALLLKPDYSEARKNRGNALRDFLLQQAALTSELKTESGGRDLVFYCGTTVEEWNPQTAREKGIGGSEEAVVWLSRLLHERGWKVTVYGNCGKEAVDYGGVLWRPFWLWNHRDRQDVTVLWRQPLYAETEINSDQVILDLHDAFDEQDVTPERVARLDKIFVKSKFHRSLFPNAPDEKFVVVANGIDAKLFADNGERDPMLLINTSSADRSLEAFLDCFAEIKKQVPDAKAQWAYGWEMFECNYTQRAQRMEWKAKIQARMRELGVEDLGRVNHGEIAKLYRKANIFAYPTEYAEIDCISLSKAMAAGAIPITTDFAALGDKSGHGGVFIPSKKTKDDWIAPGQFQFGIADPEQKARFVREAVKLLLNPPTEAERESMREWARKTFDWNTVADAWNEVLTVRSASAKPASVAPPTADELLLRGRAHHIEGRLGEAQALYRETLKASPSHPDALHLLGVIACQIGQYGLGVELIDSAIRVKPDFADAYFSRGNGLYELRQFQAAVESYDKAIELKPLFAEAWFSRGNALHTLQQYAAAIESYNKAIQLNPRHAEAHGNRGAALYSMRQYREALESYDRAIELKPDYPDAHCNRGTTLYALEQYEAAVESCDKAIVLKPDFAAAHDSRGNALQALRQYLAALECYDKAIELNPLHAESHNNRGSALHALGQYETALANFDKAIELKPDYPDALRNRENTQQALDNYVFFKPDYEYEKERKVFEVAVKEARRIAKIQDKAEMKAELDALPQDLRSHPAVSNVRSLNFVKTESSGRDLVFYCSPPNEMWNPETAKTKGVGGSEEAIIWLSRLLHERGWNVTVYGNCGMEEKEYDGVLWKPYWMCNSRDKQDVTVIWRYQQLVKGEINSDVVIVDLHDVVYEREFTPEILQRVDKVFVKSKFHRSLFPHIPDDKFVILPNGIDAKLFEGNGYRDPMLLINTSSADRGMEAFLDCFEEIKKQVPDAKAQWAYGWGVWDFSYSSVAKRAEWKAKTVRRMNALGVEDRGRLSHGEVAELYRKASIFAYPSEFAEIDCISLSKAMAAGAVPITTDFAALGEKANHGGVFLASKKTKDNWIVPGQFHFEMTDPEQKARFVEEAVKLLRNPPTEKEREPMREWARSTFDWNAVADAWSEELGALLRRQRSTSGAENRKP